MAKRTKSPEFEEQFLTPELARPRFEKRHTKLELGWGQVLIEETYDNDRAEVASKTQRLDLLPNSGLEIDTLWEKAPLMDVDQLVERIRHNDELQSQIKARKKELTGALEDLMVGVDRLVGQHFEAFWDSKKVLEFGPLTDKTNYDQGRLREEGQVTSVTLTTRDKSVTLGGSRGI